MDKEDKTDTFMLMPLYFNNHKINDKVEGVYTITLPLSEIEKFDEPDSDFHEWLMYQYHELYFVQDIDLSSARYSYYLGKMLEQKMIKESQE